MAMPLKRKLLILLSLILLPIGACYAWHRYEYPYGSTHRCDIGIYMFLREYAELHGGNFPEGEDTAAALSKLVTEFDVPESQWGQLAGKAFTDEEARECVKDHGRLTEERCSWHYVPGLRTDSDPGLALFWDKTGLSHNGARTKPLRYEVTYVDGRRGAIPASGWQEFMKRQEELRGQASR